MFIDFNEFTKNTEGVVKEVCSFVGADPALYKHKELPPGMKVSAILQPCMGLAHFFLSHSAEKVCTTNHLLCQIYIVYDSVHHCACPVVHKSSWTSSLCFGCLKAQQAEVSMAEKESSWLCAQT